MEQKNLKKKLKIDKKRNKHVKKKEELPSFLIDLNDEEFERKPKPTNKIVYSSPVFFGECKQFHPIFHPVFLGGHSPPIYTGLSNDTIKSDLFISKSISTGKPHSLKKVHPPKKGTIESSDSSSHHSPGVRRVYVREITVFTPDFGQTTSEIEGEICREIPCRRIKSTISEFSEVEAENVMLSDIKEKKRDLLPYEKRMAHNHFPKEFVTVKILGPVIPASITITKIPSKRKTFSDFNFEIKKKGGKNVEKVKVGKESKEIQNKKKSEMKETKKSEEKMLQEVIGEIRENEAGGTETAEEEKPESKDGSEISPRENDSRMLNDMVIDAEDEEGMTEEEGETAEDDKGE